MRMLPMMMRMRMRVLVMMPMLTMDMMAILIMSPSQMIPKMGRAYDADGGDYDDAGGDAAA